MSDRITTGRAIPFELFDPRTVELMGCENCGFIWREIEVEVGAIDNTPIACPLCQAWGTEPLYYHESTHKDWRADSPLPNAMGAA